MLSKLEVQKSVITALRADGTLTGLVASTSILDAAPENFALPYVVCGEAVETDTGSTFEKEYREVMLYIRVYTDNKLSYGFKQADDIAKAIADVLVYPTLSVTGWTFIRCKLENSLDRIENDGRRKQVWMTFRLTLQET